MSEKFNDRSANDIVKSYYDEFGWRQGGDGSGEDTEFRTFPPAHKDYAPRSDARTRATLAGRTGTIVIVGCGDMPAHHLRMVEPFEKVICCDISKLALEASAAKLGDRGQYELGSIVDSTLPDGVADVAFAAHSIYHIGKDEQEAAIRQMIRLTKSGGRLVIIYANPRSPLTLPAEMVRGARAFLRRLNIGSDPKLYYHAFPFSWWDRFRDQCAIGFQPWEILAARPSRRLLRWNGLATAFYRFATKTEDRDPDRATKLWQFHIVVMDKA